MAKKKKKKADKALPKSIAGVKIPKELRKAGASVGELIRHPIVADVVTAGLVAAAGALAENKKVRRAAAHAPEAAGDAAEAGADKAREVKNLIKAAGGAMWASLLEEMGEAGCTNGAGRKPTAPPK
jgi:hypothetical protein